MRFCDALKIQIELSDLNQSQLARMCGWSRSQISALVTGRAQPKRNAVVAMDTALSAGGVLLRRWEESKRRDAQPDWMRRIADVEDRAIEIRISQPTLLPVLLQSEGYARAILRLGRPLATSQEVEDEAQRRMARAKHLLRDGGPRISIIVAEHVIRTAPKVAPDALPHILDLAESMVFQVLPAESALGASVGAFRLVGFADTLPVVFVEHALGGNIHDRPNKVSGFVALANLLQAEAMRPAESLQLIKEMSHA